MTHLVGLVALLVALGCGTAGAVTLAGDVGWVGAGVLWGVVAVLLIDREAL